MFFFYFYFLFEAVSFRYSFLCHKPALNYPVQVQVPLRSETRAHGGATLSGHGGILPTTRHSLQPNMQNKLEKCAFIAFLLHLLSAGFLFELLFVCRLMRVMPPFGICHIWRLWHVRGPKMLATCCCQQQLNQHDYQLFFWPHSVGLRAGSVSQPGKSPT